MNATKTGWKENRKQEDAYERGKGTDKSRREAIARNVYGPYTASDCGELKCWWWFIEDDDPLARNYYWLSDPNRWTSHWFLTMLSGFWVLLGLSWMWPWLMHGGCGECDRNEDRNCFTGTTTGRHDNVLHNANELRAIVRGNGGKCACLASRASGFKIEHRGKPESVRGARGLR